MLFSVTTSSNWECAQKHELVSSTDLLDTELKPSGSAVSLQLLTKLHASCSNRGFNLTDRVG